MCVTYDKSVHVTGNTMKKSDIDDNPCIAVEVETDGQDVVAFFKYPITHIPDNW